MALGTYIQLKAALETRLHRSNLTAQIVDYITLAEKRINRTLRLVAAEVEVAKTATVSSRTMTLPSDFGKPVALYLTTYLPRMELVYKLPAEIQVLSANGPPSYWTIDGANIATDAPANIAYTYSFRYASEYDLATTSTNTLLTKYPDLYFYGALIEAADDLKDIPAFQRYERRYSQALQEALNDSNSTRAIATLSTDIGGTLRQNIISGN